MGPASRDSSRVAAPHATCPTARFARYGAAASSAKALSRISAPLRCAETRARYCLASPESRGDSATSARAHAGVRLRAPRAAACREAWSAARHAGNLGIAHAPKAAALECNLPVAHVRRATWRLCIRLRVAHRFPLKLPGSCCHGSCRRSRIPGRTASCRPAATAGRRLVGHRGRTTRRGSRTNGPSHIVRRQFRRRFSSSRPAAL